METQNNETPLNALQPCSCIMANYRHSNMYLEVFKCCLKRCWVLCFPQDKRQNIYFRQKHGRQTTFQLFMFDPESIPEQDQALEKKSRINLDVWQWLGVKIVNPSLKTYLLSVSTVWLQITVTNKAKAKSSHM